MQTIKTFSETASNQIVQKPFRSFLRVSRKKPKNNRQCHGSKGSHKSGMWNLNETIKYINFIKKHQEKFQTEETRRINRIFCVMARQLRSRSSVQCRSHHQKMINTYGEVLDIIKHYEQTVIPYYKAQIQKPQVKIVPPTIAEPITIVKIAENCFRFQIKVESIATY